jgi:hypothetical protein
VARLQDLDDWAKGRDKPESEFSSALRKCAAALALALVQALELAF